MASGSSNDSRSSPLARYDVLPARWPVKQTDLAYQQRSKLDPSAPAPLFWTPSRIQLGSNTAPATRLLPTLARMSKISETELYAPVKRFLEGMGFETKAEIGAVDVMGVQPEKDPVIVELKVGFSLALLQQAVSRQSVTDSVYVAVPRWKGRAAWKHFKANVGLCKRLGIGVLSVCLDSQAVHVHSDPVPFVPRRSQRRKATLLSEFHRRQGDPNVGGTRGRVVTAYQQECLRCAQFLAKHGPSKGSVVAKETGVSTATRKMASNHAGWFERVSRGVYGVTQKGRKAAQTSKSTLKS